MRGQPHGAVFAGGVGVRDEELNRDVDDDPATIVRKGWGGELIAVAEQSEILIHRLAVPVKGSSAFDYEQQFAGTVPFELGVTPRRLVAVSMPVTADALIALGLTLNSGRALYASWTVARQILEARAAIHWLASADIDHDLRHARALTCAIDSFRAHEQFARVAGVTDPSPSSSELAARLSRARARIQDWAVAEGIKLPKYLITATLKELNNEDDYRLLSGVAHVKTWTADLLRETLESPYGRRAHVEYLGVSAVMWYLQALWEAVHFARGTADASLFKEQLDPFLNRIGIREDIRPWQFHSE